MGYTITPASIAIDFIKDLENSEEQARLAREKERRDKAITAFYKGRSTALDFIRFLADPDFDKSKKIKSTDS